MALGSKKMVPSYSSNLTGLIVTMSAAWVQKKGRKCPKLFSIRIIISIESSGR